MVSPELVSFEPQNYEPLAGAWQERKKKIGLRRSE